MLNKIYQNIEIRSNSEINQNWSKKYVTGNKHEITMEITSLMDRCSLESIGTRSPAKP